MLFEITAYKVLGNKRKKIYSMEIQARDAINALDRANVRFDSSRVIEIRQIDSVRSDFDTQERP